MSHELFRTGGRYKTRRTGLEHFEMDIPFPQDEQGKTARMCPRSGCAPGYFKIRCGTGVVETGYEHCFCPYCRSEGEQGDFLTREQQSYVESIIAREAQQGIERMMKDALGLDSRGRRRLGGGLISIDMTLKSSPPPAVPAPFEEELRRDVTCPHCTLEQAVFGLAIWCADCGKDIFLTHLGAELEVVRKVLGDVEGRKERLGPRVAARDTENTLEDLVSIFEAVMKFIYRRKVAASGGEEVAENRLATYGNAFQNPKRAAQITREVLGIDLFASIGHEGVEVLKTAFEKRHPITHNLGVVDRKFLERGSGAGGLGREVPLTPAEVNKAVDLVEQVLSDLYQRLFAG